ncbi:MAG: tetratricopeptide repeat protein [Deltaproteobacteria bacterium]
MKEIDYALLLIKDGKIDAARDMLADFLQSDPQNREALFNLGLCHGELGDPENAVRTLSECVKHHPDYSNAYVALGYAHSLLRQNGPAKENLLKALELDPLNAYALRNLGSLYGQEKDYDRAVECFEKLFADNPQDQQLAYGIGYAYFQAGRLDMAEKYLTAAIDLNRATQLAETAMELLRDIVEINR